MKTVLMGWELGGGRGHVQQLVPIVARYLQQGWRVVAAMRDVALAVELFASFDNHQRDGRLQILQAPRFLNRDVDSGPIQSLAQIFCNIGFDDPALVRDLIGQWEMLLSEHKPDLVFSETAPVLNMAARGRLPVLVLGTGWTVPPDLAMLPPFFPSESHAVALRRYVDRVVSSFNCVIDSSLNIDCFAQLLRGSSNFVYSLSKLDPYRDHRDENLFWPPAIAATPVLPALARKGAIVYLPTDHPARPVVNAFALSTDMNLQAYLGAGSEETIGNMRVSDVPLDFARELPGKRLMIHHGGLGTAIWCSVNRVPQLICSNDLEKRLIADAVTQHRFGGMFEPGIASAQFADLVERALLLDVAMPDMSKLATLTSAESVSAIMDASVLLANN